MMVRILPFPECWAGDRPPSLDIAEKGDPSEHPVSRGLGRPEVHSSHVVQVRSGRLLVDGAGVKPRISQGYRTTTTEEEAAVNFGHKQRGPRAKRTFGRSFQTKGGREKEEHSSWGRSVPRREAGAPAGVQWEEKARSRPQVSWPLVLARSPCPRATV